MLLAMIPTCKYLHAYDVDLISERGRLSNRLFSTFYSYHGVVLHTGRQWRPGEASLYRMNIDQTITAATERETLSLKTSWPLFQGRWGEKFFRSLPDDPLRCIIYERDGVRQYAACPTENFYVGVLQLIGKTLGTILPAVRR